MKKLLFLLMTSLLCLSMVSCGDDGDEWGDYFSQPIYYCQVYDITDYATKGTYEKVNENAGCVYVENGPRNYLKEFFIDKSYNEDTAEGKFHLNIIKMSPTGNELYEGTSDPVLLELFHKFCRELNIEIDEYTTLYGVTHKGRTYMFMR